MPVNGLAAANTMLAFGTWRAGYCLEAVWQAYKRNGASTNQAAPTAYSGWLGSGGKHHGDRNPPAGVPVWWGPKASSAAGDVVISLGGGRVVATDWPRNGVIGITTIDARERQIGRPYLGWTEDILGFPIAYQGANDMGTIDPTAANKQVIKDAIFEFFDGAGGRGANGWTFVRDAIWGQPIQAQDADGRYLYYKSATDRSTTTTKTDFPVRFSAAGFLASTNAQVAALRRDGIAVTLTPEQVEKVGADIAEALAGVISGATRDEVQGIVNAAIGSLVLSASAPKA